MQSKAVEVLDGAMLGDSNITMNGQNACFHISKSGEAYLPYLQDLKDNFASLGIEACSGHPKVTTKTSRGRPYRCCELETRNHPLLTRQHPRWYRPATAKGRKWIKVLPGDLRLTPVVLGYWFMDDGGSSYRAPYRNLVTVTFASQSFTLEENTMLQEQLASINVTVGVYCYKGPQLTTSDSTSINILFDVIEPHILPAYRYKIKRPWRKAHLVCGKWIKRPSVWEKGQWIER